MSDTETTGAVDPRLLELLHCPACRVRVTAVEGPGLRCGACGRVYPVRGGIPSMLIDEAGPPTDG